MKGAAIILIFNMFLDGQIKLSRIFDHNFDRGTDRLYEPLRIAVESLPTAPSSSNELKKSIQSTTTMQLAEMKCSRINISRAEQDIIKNSTFIPINKKLVQTANPEKRIKARSRSYRTLSVQQRIGSPMPDAMFKQSMAKGGKNVEIVYDYDTSNHHKFAPINKQNEYYNSVTASTMPRTRSATYVGGIYESMVNRAERAQTRMVKVERKSSNHSSTSIQLKQANKKTTNNMKQSNNATQYYQNCKQYTFKNDLKSKTPLDRSQPSSSKMLMKTWMPAQNDYKYNLFNLLDQPINTKCSNGLCHKNQIIAPKIKKRW